MTNIEPAAGGAIARPAPPAASPRLRAFLHRSYRREMLVVLCLKAAGLALLYFLFFAPNDRTDIPQHVVEHHLLVTPQAR